MKYTIAVFPGTFNPFTIGHQYIVEQALQIFNKVIILFAVNDLKDTNNIIRNKEFVQKLYQNNPNVIVDESSNMTYQYCLKHNACIVRGIRNTTDFNYELSIDHFNHTNGVPTYFVTTPPEWDYVSSSLVRQMKSMGDENYKKFIPKIK